MPQFMQRAAWSRVSFSLKGTTNALKCVTRSATGVYLRSRRSISRKPVTLPIKPDVPAFFFFVIPGRCEASYPESRSTISGFRVRGSRAPRNDAFDGLRPDRDFRFGVGAGLLQFLQRAAVFHRHHLAEFRQERAPVAEDLGGALRSRRFRVPQNQDM